LLEAEQNNVLNNIKFFLVLNTWLNNFYIFADVRKYEHISQACVNGNNMAKYADKSVLECKNLCSQRSDCLAFEYGVAHGGSNKQYKHKECQLQSSTDERGCDGNHFNLDLYVKVGTYYFFD
jgi:hypothetical protein